MPPDVDLVITHRDLTERAMRRCRRRRCHFADQLPRQRSARSARRLVAAQRHIDNEVKVTDSLKDSF
ncbi:hypothetical protein MJ575_28385 [Klebsiella pneumoniae]|nr:hypothetical protein MJ575_28385 [Klebsiella pneumoniae]